LVMKLSAYAKYAWFVLTFNVGVILWGAYVRATGSGAGCGSHWPLCNGVVIPRSQSVETLIEFTHRLSSGVAFLFVVGLLIWAWRVFPKGSIVRKGAVFSMLFMTTEALVGAGLVLFELVADNISIARAVSISIHLVNTFLLLACLSLTAWWSSGGKPVQLSGKNFYMSILGLGFIGMLILGVSGALTALGDTLFPVSSLAEGLSQDFSPSAHFLIRLRLLHPTIAVLVSIYLIVISGLIMLNNGKLENKFLGRSLTILIVIQLLAGLINVYLLAPVWMQIVHLLISDLIWITLVIFAAKTLSIDTEEYIVEGANHDVKLQESSSI
jgi:heme A synthase